MQSIHIDSKIVQGMKDSCLKIHAINKDILSFIAFADNIPSLLSIIERFQEISSDPTLKQAVGSLYFFFMLTSGDLSKMTPCPQTFKKEIRTLILKTAREVLEGAQVDLKQETEQLTQKVEGLTLEEEPLGKENQAFFSAALSITSNVVKDINNLIQEQEKPFSEQNK